MGEFETVKDQLKKRFHERGAWGLTTSINLKKCNPATIRDAEAIKKYVRELCDLIGMKRYGETVVVDFGEEERVSGFSMTQLIETSLISGHFANASNSVFIDVFSCKWFDPDVVEEFTRKFFEAENSNAKTVIRSEEWFEEAVEFKKGVSTALQVQKKLHSEKSKYQQIDVYETVAFGKMFSLDGVIMVTEADEFCYHEMISHPALCTHPNPRNVLIVGAGDGGVVREVLKHPEVEGIELCEIDEKVIEISKKFFPHVSKDLGNPKVKIVVQDAIEYIKEKHKEYDVIIVDSTDPVGPAEGLFKRDFFINCEKALKDEGILVTQAESFFYDPQFISGIFEKTRGIFPVMKYYYTMIPTYASGTIGFTFCSKKHDPEKDLHEERARKLQDLKYYSTGIHRAAFVMPVFTKKFFK